MKKLKALLFALILCFLTLLPIIPTKEVDAAPPLNFQSNLIIGSGLEGPSGFEFAPDGRIFILQRTGEIRIFKNGQLLDQPFTVLPSVATGDRGLIGIAFDPDFETNNYVYFYYTDLDLINRLVRFDASADIATSGPHILYETTFPSQQLHVGGSIRFGPDGKLYFAVGDNGYPPNAQDLSNPHGKILRINSNGTVPTDNPFYGQSGKLPEIWAYGFRNPWRFQFDSQTGEIFGGDVGDYTIEEVNHIERGKNYGWPICEGVCNQPGLVDPIYNYPHDGQGSAVTGGPIYRGNMFPQQYLGNLFFGDYARGFIKRLTLDANGNSTGVYDFDLNAGSVVDMKAAPDGSMYYITYYPGRLYRITYSTGNQIPVANAGADVTKGIEPLTVHFTNAGSFDPDNDPLTFHWDFGDQTTSSDPNPTKTYAQKGTYVVELTVSDNTNSSQAVPIVIQVGTPPTVTIGEPTDGSTYKAGDTVHYTAFAQDGAGFDLNDANISTEVIFHHNTHTHPFLGPVTGRQGTFTIPTTGEAAADTYFEIKVTATDTNGLATTKSVFIYPQTSILTLTSNIPGIKIFLDGVPTVTDFAVEQVVNFTREISAPILQVVNGVLYQFESWSDGGFIKHFITISENDMSISANYSAAPPFNAQFFNNTDLSGNPAVTRQDNLIDFTWGDASPDPQINADFFSARWTKNQNFKAGKYKFTAVADDGVRLFVDGNLLIDQWHDQAATFETTIELNEGDHVITFEYYEAQGGAVARLFWDLTPDQPVSDKYRAEYYNNVGLSGIPVLTRSEDDVNYDWGMNSPDPSVSDDFFSARWTKTISTGAGNWEFTVTADDGVRLYFDGELILNKWFDQPPTVYKVNKLISSGAHEIKLEYYEKTGGSTVKLSYVQTALQTGKYSAKYWNVPAGGQPQIPSAEPDFQNTTDDVNFVWDSGSPDPAISQDHFAARFTNTQTFQAGTYRFSTTADDGVRIFLDNELIVDAWLDQAATNYTADKFVTDGEHELKIEYYENAGGAVLKFSSEKLLEPPNSQYLAQFWNVNPGSSPSVPQTAPDAERTDGEINYSWSETSPDPVISNEHFVARWTKDQQFTQGTYRFTTLSDDGIRVFVDNDLVIDQWTDHAETTGGADFPINEGIHKIKVEYYENGGGATAKFSYSKISNETSQIEKFTSEFFNNIDLSQAPILSRQDREINFNWGLGSPDSQISPNQFSARFIKNERFESKTYNFTITADDGVRLYIDNNLVIDKWSEHDSETFISQVDLIEGVHEIRIEYFENTGNARLIYGHD